MNYARPYQSDRCKPHISDFGPDKSNWSDSSNEDEQNPRNNFDQFEIL